LRDMILTDFFDLQSCDFCGDCLSLCPELSGKIPDPAGAVRALANGLYVREVLDRCSSCMTCNAVCPHGCNPYGLVLYRWFERARENAYPVRAALVMPLEPGNAWHNIMANLPSEERQMLDAWADLERNELEERALFAGCNLQILPYMAGSGIFEGLPVFGRPDLCCGEVYYRMGALDKVQAVADNLTETYAPTGMRRVVAYCQACYNILKNVLPRYFGASFPFEVSYFGDLLAERVLSGELDVKGRLSGMVVTLQDPCHSKLLGHEFQSKPRRVLEHMGCEVREMPHNREMSLCCGLGHGAARYNPFDMWFGIMRRLREARSTGADALVVYCNSCDLLFSVGTQVSPFIMPIRHLNELVTEALGQEMPHRNLSRARSMIAELFIKGAPTLVSPRRFRPTTE
jgi:Fe-S oxidoreductase